MGKRINFGSLFFITIIIPIDKNIKSQNKYINDFKLINAGNISVKKLNVPDNQRIIINITIIAFLLFTIAS